MDLKDGDRIIDVRTRQLARGEGMYGEPGEYLRHVDGRGWWHVQEDGSYRRVDGALVEYLEEKWKEKHGR